MVGSPTQPAAPSDAILFAQVPDDLVLLALEPTEKRRDEKVHVMAHETSFTTSDLLARGCEAEHRSRAERDGVLPIRDGVMGPF